MDYQRRQARARDRFSSLAVDAWLVSHLPNIRYLTGFSGSNALLLLTSSRAWLFTDGRYREQAANEVQAAGVVIPPRGDLWKAAAARAARAPTIGFEAEHVTVAQRARFLHHWPGKAHRLRPTQNGIEALRSIKDPEEIAAIRRAVELASSVFAATAAAARPGMLETELAGRLEFALRQAGGEGLAFDTIVASGPRSALVHGRPAPYPLPRRGFVVLDYGVILGGYVSDMTRTVHMGKPDRRARDLYARVLEAQQAALAALRPGVACAAVDQAARRPLQRAGLGKFFPHSTGHGVGLEIHEAPRLAATATELLAAGQVVTIEPGVYVPGWGGIRIEDVALITENGAEVLTPTPKAMLTL
ncbi:MAG TPA: Xaa-Pro peptidase family protein [Terriglobales bacterium]|nr:Xaa-Pro peptidase family protein [Terriglobales bacterium]